MTREEFILASVEETQKKAKEYGVYCVGAIIAQSIKESASGTSELAVYARNFHGLKWHEESSSGGIYNMVATERKPDGTYIKVPGEWGTYKDLNDGIDGYFKFLFDRPGVTRYNNLKGITDSRKYLETICADSYCTAEPVAYTESCLSLIKEYGLDKYDIPAPGPQPTPTPQTFISPLSTYYKLSPTNRSRDGKIPKVFIPHVWVGQVTAKQGVDKWSTSTGASSSYVIGYDGSVGCSVPENLKPGTTGGDLSVNGYTGTKVDYEAITVEMACDPKAPYAITEACENALVNLMADVAVRWNWGLYKWHNNKSLVGNWEAQNIALHRWFASKSCPGDDVLSKLPRIVEKANIIISGGHIPQPVVPVALPTLKNGSKGAEALALQKDLNYLGFTDNNGRKLGEDGILGTCSIQALKKFQTANKIAADGIYGNGSYGKMLASIPLK